MHCSRLVALAIALIGSTVVTQAAVADTPGTQMVLTVGAAKLTVKDIDRRLAEVPAFQLRTFGKTPEEIRRAFVERVVVPELLHSQQAEREHLQNDPRVRARVLDTLKAALHLALIDQVARQNPVTVAQVKAYYEAHQSRFDIPRRIRIWRILLSDKSAAQTLLRQIREDRGLAQWPNLARTRSIDKATAMRSGDLGFVEPDGQTDVPRVKVDPALFSAANKVKDGAVVPYPVKEGDNWAVVWRRGTVAAAHRSLADEDRPIRQVLLRARVMEAQKRLITTLRTQYLRDLHPTLLDALHIESSGDVTARDRPGVVPRTQSSANPKLHPVPGAPGLR